MERSQEVLAQAASVAVYNTARLFWIMSWGFLLSTIIFDSSLPSHVSGETTEQVKSSDVRVCVSPALALYTSLLKQTCHTSGFPDVETVTEQTLKTEVEPPLRRHNMAHLERKEPADPTRQPVALVVDKGQNFFQTKRSLGMVLEVLERIGYKVVVDENYEEEFDFIYTRHNTFLDHPNLADRMQVTSMGNHMAGIGYIAYKPEMAKLSKVLDVLPRAFILPYEVQDLRDHIASNPDKLWIQKANNHRGVHLKGPNDINFDDNGTFVQEFLQDTYLIDGKRFDVGVFVTITSFDPLRVYVWNDWVVRFCPKNYLPFNVSNRESYVIEDRHLVYRLVPDFESSYHNYSLCRREGLLTYLKQKGHDTQPLVETMMDAIATTIRRRRPAMLRQHDRLGRQDIPLSNLYEMLRFDFMIGSNMKVYLLESNMSPDVAVRMRHQTKGRFFYDNLLSSLFSLVGVANTYRTPVSNWTEPQMSGQVSSRDLSVHGVQCLDNDCLNNCHKAVCEMCLPCISEENQYMLKRAYLEHVNKNRWYRIVPPALQTQAAAADWQYEATPNDVDTDRLAASWFRGKCLQDATFCN